MVLHLDHHVVGDLVLCDLAPKDKSPLGVATFGGLQLGCDVYCSLHVYATLLGAVDMQMSFLVFCHYNHKPSIENQELSDVYHIAIHHES